MCRTRQTCRHIRVELCLTFPEVTGSRGPPSNGAAFGAECSCLRADLMGSAVVTDDLSFVSVREIAPLIASGAVSPVELVEAQLARIADLDDVLRAFIHVSAEEARGQAKAAEAEITAGSYRGPLHGVTVAHKDIIDVRGLPTTAASKVIPPRTAIEDSTVSGRLRAAGTICMGKLNLFEFASGSMGVFGFARNPWNLSADPGGSSSGSGTALGAGMVTIATGTDTGGSVRAPASLCGLAGMRPTYGRVSRYGCIPLSWSLDSIGPMGRRVADAAFMLGAMAGPDRHDLTSAERSVPDFAAELEKGLKGLRIGVPESFFFEDLDPDIDAAVQTAIRELESLGADLKPVALPASEFASAASWIIAYTEAFVFHRDWFATRSREYTPAFYHKIAAAGLTSAEERVVSQQIRQVVTREFVDAMRDVDVIVTPTNRTLTSADSVSVPLAARTLAWDPSMTSVLRPVSLSGFPALSVPIGFASENTPMGMQLIGRPWEESTLFRAGHAYEQSARWYRVRPPAFPDQIPPCFGSAEVASNVTAPSPTASVTPGWVMDMARLLGFGFVTEDDAREIAPMLAAVKDQLSAARKALTLDVEPATRSPLLW